MHTLLAIVHVRYIHVVAMCIYPATIHVQQKNAYCLQKIFTLHSMPRLTLLSKPCQFEN